MNLRLKLRRNQGLIPTEKLTDDIKCLEILGDNIEEIPSLSHLIKCESLLMICPALLNIPELPPNLKTLKIKKVLNAPGILNPGLQTVQLADTFIKSFDFLKSSSNTIVNLDLSANKIEHLDDDFFSKMTKLARLNLDHNSLKELPTSLFECRELNHLSLDANPLAEDQKQKLYDHFGIWF